VTDARTNHSCAEARVAGYLLGLRRATISCARGTLRRLPPVTKSSMEEGEAGLGSEGVARRRAGAAACIGAVLVVAACPGGLGDGRRRQWSRTDRDHSDHEGSEQPVLDCDGRRRHGRYGAPEGRSDDSSRGATRPTPRASRKPIFRSEYKYSAIRVKRHAAMPSTGGFWSVPI
jgi:hypothetical protein